MPNVRSPILGTGDRIEQKHLPVHLTQAAITEAAQDAVAALLAAGTGVTLSYNDAANTMTVTATGGGGALDAEAVRDAIGVALVGAGLITVSVNDAADTITISTTATANATDAALRDRATHTGTQPSTSISDLAEAVQDIVGTMILAGANVTKTYDDASGTLTLDATGGGGGTGGVDAEGVRDVVASALVAGARITITTDDTLDTITIATTATTNATDAALRARASHTGVQPANTISDLAEAVQDIMASTLTAGAGVGLVYDDALGTVQITSSPADPEVIRDAIGSALIGGTGVSISVDDATDQITFQINDAPISAIAGLQTALDNKVSSVNTRTGHVVLTADDVSAAASGHTHTATEISDLPIGTNGLNGITNIPPIGTTTIVAGTGVPLWWNDSGRSLTIVAVRLVLSASGAGSVIVDVNINGTSAFTLNNRPRILAGETTGVSQIVAAGIINPGQYISVDIDQASTYPAGTVLTVLITAV